MQRLSVGQKLGYGIGDSGGALSYVAINTWLLYYLINIAGLTPILAGTTFIVGRILDAVLDPVFGMLSDRWRPRFGRLVFVRWAALPAGASFALMWLLPLADTGKFVLAVFGFTLFSAIYTVVLMPYLALLPEIAPDYDDRTRTNSYRFTFALISNMLAFTLPPVIVVAVTGAGDLASSPASGWLVMGLVFGVLISAAFLATGTTVKEPPGAGLRTSSIGLVSEVRTALGTRGFTEVFALFVIVTLGLMIVNSMLPFYLESALRLGSDSQPLVLGLLFGVAILAFPVWATLSARIGKRAALICGLLLQGGSLLALVTLVPAGQLSAVLFAVVIINGFGVSAVTLFPWSMLPDVVEFDELESGRRREGIFFSLFTFGQKTAGSVGVFANGIVVAVFGYQQGVAVQSDFTVGGLELVVGPVAAAVFGLAIILTWRYPITRQDHRRAQATLADRRAEEQPESPGQQEPKENLSKGETL